MGEIEIELLKRGAREAVNLELSPAYDDEADRLLTDAGLSGRAARRRHDIAVVPDAVDPADVVVLHRVVCCYPDYERLLAAAGDHANRVLVFSFPRRNLASRSFVALQNLGFRLAGKSSGRSPIPGAMLAVLRAHGLVPAFGHAGHVWQVAGLRR